MSQTLDTEHLASRLRQAGLRPTKQRLALMDLLFAKGHRHVTAEMLYEEARLKEIAVSLATIYNTLNQFTEARLLRELAIDGSKTYFDTNTSNHHHFFCEHNDNLMDIPVHQMTIHGQPEVPEGMEIHRIDVVVRLVKTAEQ